ncbi:MAG: hypothetical protein J6Z25_00595 [Opitutales bacterium]|nr:hypothetical protein [Opitutales bacterium]
MKRFFHLQLFLLLIGIISWITTIVLQKENFHLTLPYPSFLRSLPIPFQASQVIVTNRQLVFLDAQLTIQTTQISAPCIRFSFLPGWNFLKGWQCTFHKGTLQNHLGMFSSVTGCIQKNRKGYRGLLSAQHKEFGSIQLHTDDFIPTKTFSEFTTDGSSSPSPFSFKNLQLHASGSYSNLLLMVHASKGKHQTGCPNVCVKNISLQGVASFEQKNPVFYNVHVSGKASVQNLGEIPFHGIAPSLSVKNPSNLYFTIRHPNLSGSGKLQLSLSENQWKFFSGSFFVNGFPPFSQKDAKTLFPSLPDLPYSVTFHPPIYLHVQGNTESYVANLLASHLQIEQDHFQNATVDLAWEKSKKELQWEANLSNVSTDLQSKGHAQIGPSKGQVFFSGHIDPKLLKPLLPWLPSWWESLSDSFQFFQQNPYANVEIQWDSKKSTRLFGYATSHACDYQQIHAQNVAVSFGHQPGFCWIKIHQLQTLNGEGGCWIQWPYDPQNETHKQWQFSGSGSFPIQQWETILHSFLPKMDTKALKLFSPLSTAKAKFNGCFSAPENPQDHVTIDVQSPQTKIDTFPVKDLAFSYNWNAQQVHIQNISGLLFHTAPVRSQLRFKNSTYECQIEGEKIPTEALLRQPIFSQWVSEIPANNLETYYGMLDANIQAQGQWHPTFSIQGTGSIDFHNPNLAKIHLLGPLQTILLSKMKLLPTIQLNRFTSDFSFDNHEILASKAEISGATTRVDITQGKVDLKNQQIFGHLHFSFLDSHQTKLPILKQIFQVFSPVTRGFSASCKGSFQSPTYSITFNPFRWLLPSHPTSKKKKR